MQAQLLFRSCFSCNRPCGQLEKRFYKENRADAEASYAGWACRNKHTRRVASGRTGGAMESIKKGAEKMNDNRIQQLLKLWKDKTLYQRVAQLLDYDLQTGMPFAAGKERGEQAGLLAVAAHKLMTSAQIKELLEETATEGMDLETARDIEIIREEVHRISRLPEEYVERAATVVGEAQTVWESAHRNDDFAAFAPFLEKIFELKREYASYFAPYYHIYDPLLGEYEENISTEEVIKIFDFLRDSQSALVKSIATPASRVFSGRKFDHGKQLEISRKLMNLLHFDWSRGTLAESLHPFTTTLGTNDVRITTNIRSGDLSCIWSVLHETGHALYDQHVLALFPDRPRGVMTSLALHEAQSRMWENIFGRSEGFLRYLYRLLRDTFGAELSGITEEAFLSEMLRVTPGAIRIDADEATYNLHIMLRMELEIALLKQEISVQDLPGIWREKMRQYLGIEISSDREGVLQDVHWACGSIGYFPTYALGNLISVQYFEKAREEIPDLENDFAKGDTSRLLGWLQSHVYKEGQSADALTVVKRATGKPLDPALYLRYLENKYGRR